MAHGSSAAPGQAGGGQVDKWKLAQPKLHNFL